MAAKKGTSEAELVERDLVCHGLLLAGFDPNKASFILHRDIFVKPSTTAFFEVIHFILSKFDEVKAKAVFRGCYPIVDRKQELFFRKAAISWIKELEKNWEIKLPSNLPTLFLSPKGRKVYQLVQQLLQVLFQRELLDRGELFPCKANVSPAMLSTKIQEISGQLVKNLKADVDQHHKFQASVNKMEADIKDLNAAIKEDKKELEKELPGFLKDEELFEEAMLRFNQITEKVSQSWEKLQEFITRHQDAAWPMLASMLTEEPSPQILAPVPAAVPPLVMDSYTHLLFQHDLRRLHEGTKLSLESFLKLLKIVVPLYCKKLQAIPDQSELVTAVETRNKELLELKTQVDDYRKRAASLLDPEFEPQPLQPVPLSLPTVLGERDWTALLPPEDSPCLGQDLVSQPHLDLTSGSLQDLLNSSQLTDTSHHTSTSRDLSDDFSTSLKLSGIVSLGCFSPVHNLEEKSLSLLDSVIEGEELYTSLLPSPAATPPRPRTKKPSVSPSMASLVARYRALVHKKEDNSSNLQDGIDD